MSLPRLEPMRLARRPEPFDHPDWLYEVKFDGFRALAYIEDGKMPPRFASTKRVQIPSLR
jgi:bifunctional non-homologous end joining protein LigD